MQRQRKPTLLRLVLALQALLLASALPAGAEAIEAPAILRQYATLVSQTTEDARKSPAIRLKPAECTDNGNSASSAFRSCFLEEANDCFYVQTQAEDREPSIFAFAAHLKPHCPAVAMDRAEAAFLEVFLSCGDDVAKSKAMADFIARPVDLSAADAHAWYSDYVSEHGAYPGYQLQEACPAMTGVNIHDVIDGYPHRGIALYDLSGSTHPSPPQPKAN